MIVYPRQNGKIMLRKLLDAPTVLQIRPLTDDQLTLPVQTHHDVGVRPSYALADVLLERLLDRNRMLGL